MKRSLVHLPLFAAATLCALLLAHGARSSAGHESDWLWRVFHQIHHSPRRLEAITSFYRHPTAVGEFFYHANIGMPVWVGYVFQRPADVRFRGGHERAARRHAGVSRCARARPTSRESIGDVGISNGRRFSARRRKAGVRSDIRTFHEAEISECQT
ncbi:sterol desaturase family protein [Massilia sp. TWR1-2-2]|uniref:sterol desaturase family protein n=1 Tax=Massilia sp. TWR1-2-2 TaxID=2804584 RepID=UPI003CE8A5CA